MILKTTELRIFLHILAFSGCMYVKQEANHDLNKASTDVFKQSQSAKGFRSPQRDRAVDQFDLGVYKSSG